MNAEAFAVPQSSEFIVLFNWGAFNFLLYFTKIVSALLVSDSQAGTLFSKEAAAIASKKLSISFGILMDAYLIGGYPILADKYLNQILGSIKDRRITESPLLSRLLSLSQSFLAGHELGHIQNGDLQPKATVQRQFGSKRVMVSLAERDRELAADWSGLLISSALFEAREDAPSPLDDRTLYDLFVPSLKYGGGAVFLSAGYVTELALAMILSGREARLRPLSATHRGVKDSSTYIAHACPSIWGTKPTHM